MCSDDKDKDISSKANLLIDQHQLGENATLRTVNIDSCTDHEIKFEENTNPKVLVTEARHDKFN